MDSDFRPEASDVKVYPICKICDRGTLRPRKIFRLSGPAVTIGYILLIPSILGLTASAILLIGILLAGITAAAHGSTLIPAFAGGGIAIVLIGIGCFVGGLLGWLLVMKKHVLQCDNCGAIVNASAAVAPPPRFALVALLFLVGITAAFCVFIYEHRLPSSTPTATTAESAEPAQPTSDNSVAAETAPTAEPAEPTAESVEPTSDNSTVGSAQLDTMQPFTSADGRFSVLFPGAPRQTSQPLHWKNGETGTIYDFIGTANNGKTGYVVGYTDSAPDVVAEGPQAHLQSTENGFIAGKTLLSDRVIDLDGVPGRAFTAADSQFNYIVRDFVDGTRSYRLTVITPKGYSATQADQFMNSFSIQ